MNSVLFIKEWLEFNFQWSVAIINDMLCFLEDIVMSGVKIEKPIFILGHARSGTTNLFECLANPKYTSASRFEDILCTSYIFRLLFQWPLKYILNYAYQSSYDSPAHRVHISYLCELHEYLYAKLKASSLQMIFPRLTFLKSGGMINAQDMGMIKKYIQRKLVWDNKTQYVCKSIELTHNAQLIKEIFPDARIILCVRKVEDCVSSTAGLWYSMPCWEGLSSVHKARLFRNYISCNSLPCLKAIQDETIPYDILVDFENWRRDPQGILDQIRDTLDLDYSPIYVPKREGTGVRITDPIGLQIIEETIAYIGKREKYAD